MTIFSSPLLRQRIGLLAVSSFLLAASGLYGIVQESFWIRWAYWAVLVGIGIWFSDALARQLRPRLLQYPWLVHWLVFSSVLSLPIFGMVVVIQGLGDAPLPASAYVNVAIKVWLVTVVITAFGLRSRQTLAPHSVPEHHDIDNTAMTETTASALLERSSKQEIQSASLWAIGAEDHYVRLITDQGEDMVLMRFSDAIREVKNLEGIQTHRSWWVAKEAIASFEKKAESGTMTLHSGHTVPVSRQRLKELKSRNWL